MQLRGQHAAPVASATAIGGTFTTFDPPGSTFTTPVGINPAGAITGYYQDASFVTHGFLRAPGGTFTTFDPPSSTYTQANAINPAGAITGLSCDAVKCPGFLRATNGTFATFEVPGECCAPFPTGINSAGTITGYYFDASGNSHGFLRALDGTLTTFDPPGSFYTQPNAINEAGSVTGFSCDQLTPFGFLICHAFLRAPGGAFTTFDPLGTDTLQTIPLGINTAGAITGWDLSLDFTIEHGFLRAPGGTVTSFDVPGSFYTQGSAINPAGAITGFYFDATTSHGFLRRP